MNKILKRSLNILSWIFIPLGTLVLFLLCVVIYARFLESFTFTAILATLTTFGLLFLLIKFNNKKKFQSIFSSLLIIFLLVWIFTDQIKGSPTPKPAPEGKVINHWNLSTGSRLGYVKYTPDIDNGNPPILYVHGGPGVSTVFGYNFAELLAKNGFTVYAYDQAGSGFSDNLPLEEYSAMRSIKDIEAIRKQLGVDKIILIGHSYGGTLVASYLTKYSDNVHSAVLMAPSGYGEELTLGTTNLTDLQDGIPGMPEFKNTSPKIYLAMILSGLGASPSVLEDLVTQQQSKWFVENNLKGDRLIKALYCNGKTPDNPYPKMKYLNMNILASSLINKSTAKFVSKNDLKTVQTPVLILRGNCDYIPIESSKIYEKMMPNAQWTELKDYGHNILIDGLPISQVLEFLNKE